MATDEEQTAHDGDATRLPMVAIAICTYRRPEALRRLLAAAIERATEELPHQRPIIVVADDDPGGSARDVVEAVRATCLVELHYLNPASGNVSVARSAALDEAVPLADWVACIDDDCIPHPGWLSELLRIARVTGAQVVTGHHEFIAPPGAPEWLSRQPFLHDHGVHEDAGEPASGNMANVLLSSAWLASSGVRFRADLGRTGGEDMVFFADAKNSGAMVRHSAHSSVEEPYSGQRTTLGYHLYRQTWLGNNEAHINRITRAYTSRRLILRGVARSGRGAIRPVRRLIHHEPPEVRWSLALVGKGIGLILGVVGVRMHHH